VNVKEYISSGIIESYVMGLATDTERQEFEALCAQHPELAEARTAFEKALEERLLHDAVAPPVHLKEVIQQRIKSELNPVGPYPEPMDEETPVRSVGVWKWLAAACLLLLAGTAITRTIAAIGGPVGYLQTGSRDTDKRRRPNGHDAGYCRPFDFCHRILGYDQCE
jgi:hypothetical protein